MTAHDMNEYVEKVLFGTLVILLFLAPYGLPEVETVPYVAEGSFSGTFEPGTFLFTGDVFLGRAVERIMQREGTSYPFIGIAPLLQRSDIAVGNFEAAVPEVHDETPAYTFRFSVRREYMPVLREQGFDVLSLANNHTNDFGKEGLFHTRAVCNASDLSCVGDPLEANEYSAGVFHAGDASVGILALHTLFSIPSREELVPIIEEMGGEDVIRVAYVHWGVEYDETHSTVQAALAHLLIDLGMDAVIGHHPHVVQDIEMYKGKPIFYSLGNLIFDQYLSKGTETGLIVQMKVEEETIRYTLVPVSSIETPSQPHVMNIDERDAFVEELFARSSGVSPYQDGTALLVSR